MRSTSVNHGGKTNGYMVPNPNAQGELVRAALDKAGIHARTVSYIEAHGTGTDLGDPIEITGLTQAFSKDTKDTGFCAIGSAKSNIGHLEAAAGIAGLTKIVLQMKHKMLVPSLHSQELNPNIRFAKTPFVVQQLKEWKRPVIPVDGESREYPRTAGVSSFGAGGANAHVILEEFVLEDGEFPGLWFLLRIRRLSRCLPGPRHSWKKKRNSSWSISAPNHGRTAVWPIWPIRCRWGGKPWRKGWLSSQAPCRSWRRSWKPMCRAVKPWKAFIREELRRMERTPIKAGPAGTYGNGGLGCPARRPQKSRGALGSRDAFRLEQPLRGRQAPPHQPSDVSFCKGALFYCGARGRSGRYPSGKRTGSAPDRNTGYGKPHKGFFQAKAAGLK
ncbi:polyketide synthase [Paenibacillus sp. P26]|nr:polyketide synthase [Paenibacillus sp. P26]